MKFGKIIAEIDAEIVVLQKARAVLFGSGRTKRALTPEGKKNIAEGMKRRWATRRADATKSAKGANKQAGKAEAVQST
jgi:hypothetical protein